MQAKFEELLPDLDLQRLNYYHGKLSKSQANALLVFDGDFLVRVARGKEDNVDSFKSYLNESLSGTQASTQRSMGES